MDLSAESRHLNFKPATPRPGNWSFYALACSPANLPLSTFFRRVRRQGTSPDADRIMPRDPWRTDSGYTIHGRRRKQRHGSYHPVARMLGAPSAATNADALRRPYWENCPPSGTTTFAKTSLGLRVRQCASTEFSAFPWLVHIIQAAGVSSLIRAVHHPAPRTARPLLHVPLSLSCALHQPVMPFIDLEPA